MKPYHNIFRTLIFVFLPIKPQLRKCHGGD
uniref:Uncharacterized protein n=1 Tax=Anguilla anguilla TaxID=7936 RepID=A0A0E9PN24_ANGAN